MNKSEELNKSLNKAGELDYDFKNDILFFKVKDREYSHSVELNNLVIDFDEEDFVVGIQIFDASNTFGIIKNKLNQVKGFKMQASVNQGLITVKLFFSTIIRNQQKEHNPIIFERINEDVPNSKMICNLVR